MITDINRAGPLDFNPAHDTAALSIHVPKMPTIKAKVESDTDYQKLVFPKSNTERKISEGLVRVIRL